MAVYVMQAGEGGPVKIGTTTNIKRRLALIQNAQAVKVTLVRLMEGGPDEERALHRRFAEFRLHGEWFSPEDEILTGDLGLPNASHPSKAQRKRHPGLTPEQRAAQSARKLALMSDPIRGPQIRAAISAGVSRTAAKQREYWKQFTAPNAGSAREATP